MTEDMLIRHLEEADFERLLALFEAVAAERRWIGTEPDFDQDRYRDGWEKTARGERGAGFVAIHVDELVGYLGVHPMTSTVTSSECSLTCGTADAASGKRSFPRRLHGPNRVGCPSLVLFVFPHNEAAVALYRNAGFEQRDYFYNDVTRQTGDVSDTILMTKTLPRHGSLYRSALSSPSSPARKP